jgi:glucose-1-phosphate cytidylyltransferase
MREETEYRPKPMVEIGGHPMLWHIMKNFAAAGFRNFIIAAGYKSEMIKDYFLNYRALNSDVTVDLQHQGNIVFHQTANEDWQVTIADTGPDTPTGARVLRAAKYVEGERFMCTYGDGLADVSFANLCQVHEEKGLLATVTTVRPTSRFGVADIGQAGVIERFREKPQVDGWVNAGFMVFEKGALEYFDESSMLEDKPMMRLAGDGQLAAYQHDGFWQWMDTYRELVNLNELWASGRAPWRTW